jgi:hypothetical protein
MKVLQFIVTHRIKLCKKLKVLHSKPLPIEIMVQAKKKWGYYYTTIVIEIRFWILKMKELPTILPPKIVNSKFMP